MQKEIIKLISGFASLDFRLTSYWNIMSRNFFSAIFSLALLASALFVSVPVHSQSNKLGTVYHDTLNENQILYNGRYWRNQFYKIKEDQFLFSNEFLPGSVTILGNTFKNVEIKYDIYNDEILIPTSHGSILQLNKEMVDSFKIFFQSKTYRFTRIHVDSLRNFQGYFNVVYDGKTTLFIKFKKEISLLAYEGKYDVFYQTQRIYFIDNNAVNQINSKRDLFSLLGDNKLKIKNFIKQNKLKISIKNPDSIVPVLSFYDAL